MLIENTDLISRFQVALWFHCGQASVAGRAGVTHV